MDEVICEICSKKFLRKRSHISYHKHHYCSRKCAYEGRKKGKVVKCHICEKISYKQLRAINKSKTGKFFCSKKCSLEWQNTVFVREKHPNWKNGHSSYRLFFKKNSGPACCKLCNLSDERMIIVHHLDMDRSNNSLKNLMWLCYNCHFLIHNYPSEMERLNKKQNAG